MPGKSDCLLKGPEPSGNSDEFFAREQQGGEMASVYGAGIYTYPVFLQQRLAKDRMSEDDRLAKGIAPVTIGFLDPQAPMLGLLAEVAAWLQSGMDINGVLILPPQGKRAEKGYVFRWDEPGDVFRAGVWRQAITV